MTTDRNFEIVKENARLVTAVNYVMDKHTVQKLKLNELHPAA